jgi:hypothetical protein
MSAAGACLLLATVGCGQSGPPRPSLDMSLVNSLRAELGDGALGGGGGASAASRGTPTGWATIKGTFRLTGGAAPAMPAIQMPNNKDMCPPAKLETLVVGGGGGIRDVLIYLDGNIPDDSGESAPLWTNPMYNLAANAGTDPASLLPQQRQQVVFDQKNCRFLDHVFAFRSDQALEIKNSDPFGHNTNLKPQDSARPFDKTIPPGSSTVYEPGGAEKRPFPVACAIHPWMAARMIICPNPYFAITDENGAFEIRGVPAGVDLEFRIWQEQANYLKEIIVNGKPPEKLSSGKYKLKLENDEVRNLDVEVDVAKL